MGKTPPIAKGDRKRIEEKLKKHFALPIKEAKNSIYTKWHFVRLLLVMSLLNGFAESISNFLIGLPQADTLLLKLKSLSMKKIQEIFMEAYERIFEDAKHLFRGKVYLAIDFHNKPYYGKPNKKWAVGSKKEKSTKYFCRFITIEIVTPNRRFTLLALPVSQLNNNKARLVEELIRYAQRFVKIKAVLLDRSFFTIEVIKRLWALHVDFIIPAIKDSKIKKLLARFNHEVIVIYTMGRKYHYVQFQLVLCKNEKGEWIPYATNMDLRGKPIQYVRIVYDMRWGIETGYRVKKEDFCAKTCADSWEVRTVYFLFSVLLYNVWTLINSSNRTIFGMSRITAKIFILAICIPILLAYSPFSLSII